MDRSDKFLLALNAFLLAWAAIAFGSADLDVLLVGALVAMAVAAVNGFSVYRRREPAPVRKRRPLKTDEMDAATVLDLDARLEALERAQLDAVDAARWRALVESGEVSGPAAEAEGSASAPTPVSSRNGRA